MVFKRPKHIPATKRFRGKIYHYYSHGESAMAMKIAKGLRTEGHMSHVAPSGRPGVSVVYWKKRK